MAKNKKGPVIEAGEIQTLYISSAHKKIKKIVDSYKEITREVDKITNEAKENWVGDGRDEFESQYKSLIKKIDDFGETLQDIYEALVQAEADYASADDSLRQQYAMAMED